MPSSVSFTVETTSLMMWLPIEIWLIMILRSISVCPFASLTGIVPALGCAGVQEARCERRVHRHAVRACVDEEGLGEAVHPDGYAGVRAVG